MNLFSYRRPFVIDDVAGLVRIVAALDGLSSELLLDGAVVARDHTPAAGEEAIRSHRLAATLPDGRALEVEAGYINWVNVGIAVRVDGALVHESHPGRRIAYPAAAAKMILAKTADGSSAYDPGKLKQNKIPIMVDLATALFFFVVAKLTDLQTAAIAGAAVGIGLLVVQRFVKVDLIGGMALFGIVMLLISAGFAILFEDDELIKQRSTIVGLIGAGFFLIDGLLGGRRLGQGLSRYLVYRDVNPRRLALGMAMVGASLALLNYGVVKLVSTDVWLFYTTFVDVPISIAFVLLAIKWSRSGPPPARAS